MRPILNAITFTLLGAAVTIAAYPKPAPATPIIVEYHHINDVCAADDLGLIRLTVDDVIELI